jgi:hypothetical protein
MTEDRMQTWRPDDFTEELLRSVILPDTRWKTAWTHWRESANLDFLTPGAYRLLPLLYKRLRAEKFIDPWMGRLQGIYRHTWARNQILLRDAAEAVRILNDAGIPVMLIKGAAMILGYYHDAGACPTTDVDILIPEAQAVAAVAALLAAGYAGTGRYEGNVPEKFIRTSFAHAFRNPRGNELDLHWHLLYLRAFPGADADYWKHAVPAELAGMRVWLPSATDALLLACLHGLGWSDTSSLRWVADADYLIRQANIDWDRLGKYARWRGIALPLGMALRYLRDRLELPIPEAPLRLIESLPVENADRWVLKTYSGPGNLFWNALSLWFRYSRFCRNDSPNLIRLLAGLPEFMETYWALPALRQVPSVLLQKTYHHFFAAKR